MAIDPRSPLHGSSQRGLRPTPGYGKGFDTEIFWVRAGSLSFKVPVPKDKSVNRPKPQRKPWDMPGKPATTTKLRDLADLGSKLVRKS